MFYSFLFFKFNRQIYRNLINKLEFEGQKFLSKSYELKRRKYKKCNLQKWTPFSSASNSFLNMSKFFKFTPLFMISSKSPNEIRISKKSSKLVKLCFFSALFFDSNRKNQLKSQKYGRISKTVFSLN